MHCPSLPAGTPGEDEDVDSPVEVEPVPHPEDVILHALAESIASLRSANLSSLLLLKLVWLIILSFFIFYSIFVSTFNFFVS